MSWGTDIVHRLLLAGWRRRNTQTIRTDGNGDDDHDGDGDVDANDGIALGTEIWKTSAVNDWQIP